MIDAPRLTRALCGLLLGLFWLGVPVDAQLTDLGALVLDECDAPGDCLQFEAFGDALAAGDFDSDGFEDLAIAVPGQWVGGDQNAGAVHIFYGSPAGLTSQGEQIFDQDTPGIGGGAEPGDFFGRALAVGDFDRDGYADLAIGVNGEDLTGGDDAGAVAILFGSSGGLLASGSLFLSQNTLPPGSSESTEEGDGFGRALAASPDGLLGIGVPNEDFFLINENNAGLVHVLLNQKGDPFEETIDVEQNDYILECGNFDGNEFNESWGLSLAWGRFSSGFPGLAVAGQFEGFSGVNDAGRVTVVTGIGQGCFDQNTTGIADTAEEGDFFGAALAAGDFDDDGFEDLAIGVPGEDLESSGDTDAGVVQILFGGADGLDAVGDQLFDQDDFLDEAAQDGDAFGSALASGDFDGDGIDDLAIGAPVENVGSVVDAGTVNVLYGGATGMTLVGNQTFNSNFPSGMPELAETDDHFGGALAAGDFDGNGTDDLVIGMPDEGLNGQAQAGAVTVLYGLDAATDAFGTVHFGSAQSVSEETANRIVFVTRVGGAVLAASVDHSRTGGTATPGTDFTYSAGTESWTAGELGFETHVVHVVADTLDEGDETVVLALANPSAGLALGSPSTFTLTIEDDDEGGAVQFAAPSTGLREDAGSIGIAVARSGGAASGVTVEYATSNVSAVAGSDYTTTSGTLTFAASDNAETITVPILDDKGVEGVESFLVTLSSPGGGASLGAITQFQVFIVSDDIFHNGFETGNSAAWSDTVP